jgi:hypothetical protein
MKWKKKRIEISKFETSNANSIHDKSDQSLNFSNEVSDICDDLILYLKRISPHLCADLPVLENKRSKNGTQIYLESVNDQK